MAETAPRQPAYDKLWKAISEQEKELESIISRRSGFRRGMLPERQRVLGVIHESLSELLRLYLLEKGVRSYDVQALDQSVFELVSQHDAASLASLTVPAAWEYALCLQRLLLLIGDRHYIKAQLMSEWRIERAEGEYVYGRWSRFFDRELLEDLVEKYKRDDVAEDSATHRQAVEYLTYLSVTRNSRGRALAASSNTRTRYLDRLTMLLAGLLLLLLAFIYIASHGPLQLFNPLRALWDGNFRLNFGHPDFKHALIAAAAGAAGSALSGFYTLRDRVQGLSDLRSFRAAMWAQPLVGATAGVLVFLIIRSGVTGLKISVDGELWPAFGIYGFLAGFSEPFFLGLVSRVAGTADEDEGGKDGDDGGGQPPLQPPPAGEGVAIQGLGAERGAREAETDEEEDRTEPVVGSRPATVSDERAAGRPGVAPGGEAGDKPAGKV